VPVVNSVGAGIFTTHTAIMGKYARHNYHALDFRRLVCFMAKELEYSDKKIASMLGLKPIYFAFIVGQIPELSEALEKVRDSQNQAKRDKNGRCRRKITSMTVTIPEISCNNHDLI
jgi:hypothetical protein